MLERGVLIRDMSTVVSGCLRVTAGTEDEVDRFLEALDEVLRAAPSPGIGTDGSGPW